MSPFTKIINDSVHGHFELDELYMKIIDTLQFQRLRFIKQLGSTYFVFPGASHNRFEHSLGVCHLAESLCLHLKDKQPELNISDIDVKCVAIAGLCHDLGHGPSSHLFDRKFIPTVRPNITWKHEKASIRMFDRLLDANDLEKEFHKRGFTDEDLVFIKELIIGPDSSNFESGDWPYKGRSSEKNFLYEIVSNGRNGFDVDRWDYMERDCKYLGIQHTFDHRRFLKFARVLDVAGQKIICTREKEVHNLYNMFYTRSCLYREAYLHKTSIIIDHMVKEAFVAANDYIFLENSKGQKMKMSESIDDMSAYEKLTDDIFSRILHSTEENLRKSRDILTDVLTRKLPKFLCSFPVKLEELSRVEGRLETFDCQEDYIFIKEIFDYGMGSENPLDSCFFYSKYRPREALRLKSKQQISSMLPVKFCDPQYYVYWNGQSDWSEAKQRLDEFLLSINISPFNSAENGSLALTPFKRNNDGTSDSEASSKCIKLDYEISSYHGINNGQI